MIWFIQSRVVFQLVLWENSSPYNPNVSLKPGPTAKTNPGSEFGTKSGEQPQTKGMSALENLLASKGFGEDRVS